MTHFQGRAPNPAVMATAFGTFSAFDGRIGGGGTESGKEDILYALFLFLSFPQKRNMIY